MEAGQYDEAIDLFRALLDETGVEARSLADVRYLLALAHCDAGRERPSEQDPHRNIQSI